MGSNASIVLASSSPRRREILEALRIPFRLAPVDVDETPLPGEAADVFVLRLAAAKAGAVAAADDEIVLGADTTVVLDGQILGKPESVDEALAMLAALSGRVHRVLTGIAVRTSAGTRTALSDTEVEFRDIGRDEALAYWQSGEPRDKAGAYAIQGLGGAFVARIAGSYSGVVGLPVFETVRLLGDAGFEIFARRTGHDR